VPRARIEDTPVAGYRITDIAEFYRIPSGPAAQENARTQIGVLADMARVRDATPAQARVMWYTPDYIALLARRHGVALRRPRDAADLEAQVRATGADYIYLADAHPRDSLLREGDPLYPVVLARPFAEPVWTRTHGGRLAAVLLKIDKDKTGSPKRP